MGLAAHFFSMACNNAFANHRLLGACRGLSVEDFGAARPSFFGSIAATANHNLTVDWYYVDALERWVRGEPVNSEVGGFFEPEHPFQDPEALFASQRDVDLRLVEVCRGLDDERLAERVPIQRARGVIREDAPRYLAHLFQHQIHHRGQIHGLLSLTDVAPPQLDEFFCAGEAHKRAEDLAALGLTEDEVWR